VGGGVESGFITGGLKYGGQAMADGTFSVGTAYMNRFELMLGIAEAFTNGERIAQVFFEGSRSNTAKHG